LLLACAILAVTPGFAAAEVNVPEPLKPWVDWVLQDHEEELLCTTSYNDGDALKCDWPTSLDLDIRGGSSRCRSSGTDWRCSPGRSGLASP
jgi:hypothetical protein